MEKVLRQADKVLSEIGRLALARPLLSGILLITAVTITICSNELWNTLPSAKTITEQSKFDIPLALPMLQPTLPLPAADEPLAVTKTAALSPSVPVPAEPTPTTSSANKSSVAKQTKAATKSTNATSSTKTTSTTAGLTYASGRITRSLAVDARKAGLPAKQVKQLVDLFAQKKLAQNMHSGDEFNVLYENTKTSNGTRKSAKPVANIVAAQLTSGDKTWRLIRFVDSKGHAEYYTPEGRSLYDAISRQPVSFTHISSYFSSNRFDPVLHYRRPHEGVDFAAAIGTPVQAAGDGVLKEVAYRGGYGRMITIQHDSQYTTRYAHLSKFASNMTVGKTVKKGQIIGYVGETGFATGPHLHFEIRVNDVAENPLTVALPRSTIPAIYRPQFLATTKVLLAQLNTHRQTWLAEAKPITFSSSPRTTHKSTTHLYSHHAT